MEFSSDVCQRTPCPVCGPADWQGDNRIVYADGHTHCFACGTTEFPKGEPGAVTIEPPKALRDVDGLLNNYTARVSELAKRKISQATTAAFGYYTGNYKGAGVHLQIYRDQQGNRTGLKYRKKDKTFGWIQHPKAVQLFGQHLWKTGGKRLIITEGEIDAMSIYQAVTDAYGPNGNWPVVSLPNGAQAAAAAIKANFEFISSFSEVVLAFDMDTAGTVAVQSCVPLLKPGQALTWALPEGYKDASDALREDPQILLNALRNAHIQRPDDLKDAFDALQSILVKPPTGTPLIYPQLSEMTKGIRGGELYMITAGTGIGKSTFTTELAYDLLINHNKRIGMLALEESPALTIRRFLGLYLNKDIRYDYDKVTDEELTEAFNTVIAPGKLWLYDHFGSIERNVLLSRIEFMATSLSVDIIVLDHISIAVSGLAETDETERKTIDRLTTELRSIVERTGVSILCITHLKQKDSSRKSYWRGGEVSLGDLRGSGALAQLSDVVVALERDQQALNGTEQIARVRVLKNRISGITGLADTLKYDTTTGRLTALSADELKAFEAASTKQAFAGQMTTVETIPEDF